MSRGHRPAVAGGAREAAAQGVAASAADIRVVRGEPDVEELAALLVVWARLTAAAAGQAEAGRRTSRRPAGRPLVLTGTVAPGANAWRRSAWTS